MGAKVRSSDRVKKCEEEIDETLLLVVVSFRDVVISRGETRRRR